MADSTPLLDRFLAAEALADELFQQLVAESIALAPALERLARWRRARSAVVSELGFDVHTRVRVIEAFRDLGVNVYAQPPAVIGGQVRRACLLSGQRR